MGARDGEGWTNGRARGRGGVGACGPARPRARGAATAGPGDTGQPRGHGAAPGRARPCCSRHGPLSREDRGPAHREPLPTGGSVAAVLPPRHLQALHPGWAAPPARWGLQGTVLRAPPAPAVSQGQWLCPQDSGHVPHRLPCPQDNVGAPSSPEEPCPAVPYSCQATCPACCGCPGRWHQPPAQHRPAPELHRTGTPDQDAPPCAGLCAGTRLCRVPTVQRGPGAAMAAAPGRTHPRGAERATRKPQCLGHVREAPAPPWPVRNFLLPNRPQHQTGHTPVPQGRPQPGRAHGKAAAFRCSQAGGSERRCLRPALCWKGEGHGCFHHHRQLPAPAFGGSRTLSVMAGLFPSRSRGGGW